MLLVEAGDWKDTPVVLIRVLGNIRRKQKKKDTKNRRPALNTANAVRLAEQMAAFQRDPEVVPNIEAAAAAADRAGGSEGSDASEQSYICSFCCIFGLRSCLWC